MVAKELLEKVFVNSTHACSTPQTQVDNNEKGESHYHYKYDFQYSQELWEEVKNYLSHNICLHCLKDFCICKEDSGNPIKCKQGKCKNGN